MSTTKLAHVAKGKQTCTGCGRTKPLDQFQIHPRWGTPYKVCEACLLERKTLGARRRVAKQKAAKQEAQVKQAKAAVNEVKQSARVEVLWARLDGFALAMEHEGLTALIAELRAEVER